MNDKCCLKCKFKSKPEVCPSLVETQYGTLIFHENWNQEFRSCDLFSPLPDKPGKIEPLVDELVCDLIHKSNGDAYQAAIDFLFRDKLNELISAHNGRDGK